MKNTITSAKSMQPQIELLPPSITLRVGRRKLTLSWRARKPLPSLLSTLLRRSWRQVLAPVLRVSVATAAVCGAWQTQALAAAPAPGTLPSGWSVVNGNVTFTQNGNTLNINQLSPQAIANFLTFSIGSDAAVNISQPGAAAAFLAKVTGGDISQIYGKLTAPGTVVLFNPNGIAIGAGGVVDVGRFVATTLNISNDDFLAGKLTFAKDGAVAGSVENYGTITSATGGSVYLIGSSVTNGGLIKSPQGEVILAAGQSVTLADTGTPGVTVNVTGSAGNVTNLGSITAEAGRIGIAAGLITNSGAISASSVVREGGRIFLRASTNLTTTASSNISADGTTGGNIALYSDGKAFIDGDVSAVGTAGNGGFVETSGLRQLDVVKTPVVGAGGTWYIDPYDLEVVSSLADLTGSIGCSTVYAVMSSGSGSKILNTIIAGQLGSGVSVNLTTGAGGNAAGGNITISADIIKASGSAASLSLKADQSININANITSTSGALSLNLSTNYQGQGATGTATTIGNGARVMLNGGVLTASEGSGGSGNGVLNIANGAVDVGATGTLNAGAVKLGSSGTLTLQNGAALHAATLVNAGIVNTSGNLASLSLSDGVTNNGTINFNASTSTLSMENGLTNNGIVNFNGAGSLFSNGTVTNQQGATMNFGAGHATFNTSGSGAWVNNGTLTVSGADQVVSMSNSGGMQNNGNLNIATDATLLGTGELAFQNSGTVTLSGGLLSFRDISNDQTGFITGSGNISAAKGFTNNGIVTPGGTGTVGTLTFSGNSFSQTGSGEIRIDIGSNTSDQIIFNTSSLNLGGTLRVGVTGGYQPLLGSSVTPFISPVAASGNFRTVIADVFTVAGAKQIYKATYNQGGAPMTLTMLGAANVTSAGGDWGSVLSWDTGYLPTQIDTAVISGTTNHNSGADTVDKLVVSSGGRLNLSGGNLSVASGTALNGEIDVYMGNLSLGGVTTGGGWLGMYAGEGGGEGGEGGYLNAFVAVDPPAKSIVMTNAQSDLNVQINEGAFSYTGAVSVGSLKVYGGSVTGSTGSRLSVGRAFYQDGGTMNVDSAGLTQAEGALQLGNITAASLLLNAKTGAISQTDGTSLHVTRQLVASATGGINLGAANSTNYIAAFAASNTDRGDITLVNHLNTGDTSAVTVNGIYAANGNISVDNTGGLRTDAIGSNADFLAALPASYTSAGAPTGSAVTLASLGIGSTGLVNAANGTISLATHSPLTIGSGGVSSSGGIALTAGASGDPSSNLVINGVLNSQGAVSANAGNSLAINANIIAGGGFSPSAVTTTSYAAGVVINSAGVVTIPTPALPADTGATINTAAQQTAQQQQGQQTQSLQNTVNSASVSSDGSGTVQQASTSSNQTAGGTAGNFGDESDGKKQGGKKPLPMCT
ncbi:beta strand repeat-containing protein [Herbaspirillum robiniae]|uniref:beta strand repeat-containing protein n=1 Tax=Herbaspirillum robiniae TaxID=2014887 RepID=UPI003D77B0D6